MTWLEKFDRVAASELTTDTDESTSNEVLEALFDRYRAEGYPGVNAELPPDLIVH